MDQLGEAFPFVVLGLLLVLVGALLVLATIPGTRKALALLMLGGVLLGAAATAAAIVIGGTA